MKSKIIVILSLAVAVVEANAVSVSISTLGSTYSQDFNTLATSGAGAALPLGWALNETGTSTRNDGNYTANGGSDAGGDVYSYGTGTATDRALGSLRSGTLVPMFGAAFQNLTGGKVTSLEISYIGEEWRLGTAGRFDRLDFQYSVDAASLTVGTWIDAGALDFLTPITTTLGAKDGNTSANRTAISSTLSGLNIVSGASFWLRWTDFDASGSDDGLAVDDFSLTAHGILPPSDPIPDTGTTAVLLSIPLLGLFTLRRLTIRPV